MLTTPGTQFKVYIHACGVDAPGGSYVLNTWAMTSPVEQPVHGVPRHHAGDRRAGRPGDVQLGGPAPGNRYLGRVQTVDTAIPGTQLAQTLIYVNTR